MGPDYRIGIDIGVNSLGWVAVRLGPDGRPDGILDAGVRLFTDGRDPKTGTSLAVDRRTARAMRRRRDRYLLRREDLMKRLVRLGLMPADVAGQKALERLDPYELRAKGLDGLLPAHHFGRAIFHLNQRRGFKSNRKTDKGKDAEKEKGKIKAAVTRLCAAMEQSGARTVGEYLWRRHRERRPVRARLQGDGAKAEYELYIERAMLEKEFDLLWNSQTKFGANLPIDDDWHDLRCNVFRQRPLRPVDPGKCALDPSDKRAPEALPIAQDFRIWQEIANLRVLALDGSERKLSKAERDKLYGELARKPKLTFKQIRRLLKLDSEARFNLENEKRDHLLGHLTNVALAKEDRFGDGWWKLDDDRRAAIVEYLIEEADEEYFGDYAVSNWKLSSEAAHAVMEASLPDGYARVGRKALAKIVPIMRDQGLTYAEAAMEAGYHPSDFRPGALRDELPYYGEALERHVAWGTGEPKDSDERRYGRIANPTVHIGLNQLRRLLNACIAAHGRPAEIVVELARELKQSAKRKKEIQDEQATNQRKNEQRRQKLSELAAAGHGCSPDSAGDMLRLRLWEELAPEPHDRRCVYTGEPISIEMLFGGEIDVDHIVPFRLCLDDGAANKIVCLVRANRQKARQTPFQAFGHAPEWADILLRAQSLPKNKRWRFAADALERLKPDSREGLPAEAVADMELGDGFLARHLTDTQYLARVTREYLGHVCDPNRVWAVPGRLTAMLRGKWGLNGILSDSNLKNRADHRHHAIDAAVIALTDRAMLQRIARANEQSRARLIDDMPEPWAGFRDQLRDKLRGVVVSVRPDHGAGGRLHEDTAYGIVARPEAEEGHNLVSRKAFLGLNENEVARIRDRDLRARVLDRLAAANGGDGKLSAAALRQALADFAAKDEKFKGIRHVRILKVEQDTIAIRDPRGGAPYKVLVPGENHHIDVFEQPDGSWVAETVTVFQANQPAPPTRRRAHPAARLVMRLHKSDFVKLEHDGAERVMRVVRLEPSANRVRLVEHNEGGDLQARHDDKDDPFRWLFQSIAKLRDAKARKVHVDVLGRIQDSGPPK